MKDIVIKLISFFISIFSVIDGIRRYVKVLGHPVKNDYFSGFATYGSNLYVLLMREDIPSSII